MGYCNQSRDVCRGARKDGQERWWAFLEHVVSGPVALLAARGERLVPLEGGGGRLGAPVQEEQKTCHLQGGAFSS